MPMKEGHHYSIELLVPPMTGPTAPVEIKAFEKDRRGTTTLAVRTDPSASSCCRARRTLAAPTIVARPDCRLAPPYGPGLLIQAVRAVAGRSESPPSWPLGQIDHSWLRVAQTALAGSAEMGRAGRAARGLLSAMPMIYRRPPPQPARLILRIVATTGAGTLLGVVACGGKVGGGVGSTGTAVDHRPMGSTGSAVDYGPMGSTGSAVDYGPLGSSGAPLGSTGTAFEYPIGSTGSAVDYGPMGSSGALFGSVDASVATNDGGDATIDTGDATPLDANGATPDSRRDANEAGASDASPLDAGHILLGVVMAPPDAGVEQ